MKSKTILLLFILGLLSILISACSSTAYASTGWHGLTTSTDTVYLAAGNQAYAIDLNTGSEKWRYPAKVNAKTAFYASPALTTDGQLILPSYDTNLYSLNSSTGSENWIFTESTNRLIGSPLVTEDMIYQPSTDHFIYAVDLRGNLVWKQETDGPIWAQPMTNTDCDCVYVASLDHTVYSFNKSNGRLQWQTPDLGGGIVGTPALSQDGILYVGTFGSEVIALDTTNGNVLWRFNTEDWVWAGPTLADDTVYVGDLSGYLYALNAADGKSLWRLQPQNGIVSAPMVSGDQIFLTTEGDTLFTLSKTGNVVNSRVIGGMIYASPVISGETLLVSPTSFDSLLVAMNLDANQKWTFTPAKK